MAAPLPGFCHSLESGARTKLILQSDCCCRDELETLPGGSYALGPLEIGSNRAWLNATDPAGLSGIDGDVHVYNSHGCSEIVNVAEGSPKNLSLHVTCEQRAIPS